MWFLLPSAAAQPPECPFGVNAHQAVDEAIDLAADAGVGWVRFDFNWFQFEPQQDVYDWTIPDRFVDKAAARGLNVYVTIGYTPAWAAGSPCDDASGNPDDHCLTRAPGDRAQWEEFVRLSVQRYGDRVKAWGIWNEPNLSQFFSGSRDEWIDEILIPAATVVHAECGDCLVVGPELANLRGAHWDSNEGVCLFGECSFNGWDYSLNRILERAADQFDVISHHKYEDPADDWWDQILFGESLLGVQYVHGVREIIDLHAPGKPVWITEFGWENPPNGGHDPQYSADQLTALYGALPDVQAGTSGYTTEPWPELQKLFWYDLHDDPSGPAWGLLTAAYQPKPAYGAYGAVIGDLGGCEAFVPETTTPTGTTDTGTPPTTDTGSAPTTPGTDETDPGDTDPVDPEKAGGCGCDASGAAAGGPALLGALAWRRRRARAR